LLDRVVRHPNIFLHQSLYFEAGAQKAKKGKVENKKSFLHKKRELYENYKTRKVPIETKEHRYAICPILLHIIFNKLMQISALLVVKR
jgi:hypothetical protein